MERKTKSNWLIFMVVPAMAILIIAAVFATRGKAKPETQKGNEDVADVGMAAMESMEQGEDKYSKAFTEELTEFLSKYIDKKLFTVKAGAASNGKIDEKNVVGSSWTTAVIYIDDDSSINPDKLDEAMANLCMDLESKIEASSDKYDGMYSNITAYVSKGEEVMDGTYNYRTKYFIFAKKNSTSATKSAMQDNGSELITTLYAHVTDLDTAENDMELSNAPVPGEEPPLADGERQPLPEEMDLMDASEVDVISEEEVHAEEEQKPEVTDQNIGEEEKVILQKRLP